ncbi:MAG TPA: hypothetical protein VK186_05470 [Candidatus Deferrimicrobium sp.]|nr:hypothetical protein [Candidatus Deferrimicrobium sp.]
MNLIAIFTNLPLTRLEVSQTAQLLTLISGFVIKPVYMILSLVLIFIIRKNKTRPVSLIRWSLISFFVGESFCALNYLIAGSENEILELLHGAGMVGFSIFLPWGIFVLIDEYVLHLSVESTPCALAKLCGSCWKYGSSPCKLKQLFWFAAPALAVISLIPLFMPLKPFHYILTIYSSSSHFDYPSLVLWIELRLYPVLGTVLMLSSLFFLGANNRNLKKSQLPFFVGIGFMSFSLVRFVLVYAFYGSPHWFSFWEELTELMVIAGLCLFFFLFRRAFGLIKNNNGIS